MVSVAFKTLQFLRTTENAHNEEIQRRKNSCLPCYLARWFISHARVKRAPGIGEDRHLHLPAHLNPSQETKPISTASSLPYTSFVQMLKVHSWYLGRCSPLGEVCIFCAHPVSVLFSWELHFAFSLFNMYNDRV